MSWKQTKDFVIKNAGTKKYWCLQNVRLGYNIAPKYETAWDAWKGTVQHTDKAPAGVAIPLFFSWTGKVDGVTKNWGHVAVRLKDGRIWTDGKYYKTTAELIKNYLPAGKYVGWGETLNGARVVQKSAAPKTYTEAQYQAVVKERDVALAKVKTLNMQVETLAAELAERDKAIKIKDARIASLEAQVGDATKWQTLGVLLRELLGLNK